MSPVTRQKCEIAQREYAANAHQFPYSLRKIGAVLEKMQFNQCPTVHEKLETQLAEIIIADQF